MYGEWRGTVLAWLHKLEASPLITVIRNKDGGWFEFYQHLLMKDLHKTLKFGPLSTTLSELYNQGFMLQASGNLGSRMVTVYLKRGTERYRLYRLSINALSVPPKDLTEHVKDNFQFIHKYSEAPKQDPMQELLCKYPVKKKSPAKVMLGNMTLGEYLKGE